MEIRVLGCSGGSLPGFELSGFLVDSKLLLDAGSVSTAMSAEEQIKVRSLLLTHAHLDHIFGLSALVDNLNMLERERAFITVYSIPEVLRVLKEHIFNNQIWPDFTKIPSAERPILRFKRLQEGVETTIAGKSILPVSTNHVVSSVGYFVGDTRGRVLYVGDSGPTEKIWEHANQMPNLRAIILETSFPNRFQKLADVSKHLTPQTLSRELKKLRLSNLVIGLYHLKPQYRAEIIAEVKALHDSRLIILEQGKTYHF